MKVRALFFAHLKGLAGTGEREYDLPTNTTVVEFATLLAEEDIRFHDMLRYARPAVNGDWAVSSTVLQEGDEIGFLPPSSGG